MSSATAGISRAVDARVDAVPAESTTVHTRILRCMLAVDDCYAYWRNVDPATTMTDRAGLAFENRWFGIKSEARVRTIMTDMHERFDTYPEALMVLHKVGRIPATLRALICHVHTQLADPVYRAFTGSFLSDRRDQGRTTVDRPTVARWVETLETDRWSTVTCVKFASNLLATALDAGLVRGRRDPRELPRPTVPEIVLGYVLYLLRGVHIDGTLTENPYFRSLGVSRGNLGLFAPRIPGVRVAELGRHAEITFLEPSLMAWGLRYLGEGV